MLVIKLLKFSVQNINSDLLNTFNSKVITQHQHWVASLVISLLKAAIDLSSTYNKTRLNSDIQHKVMELKNSKDLQLHNKPATSQDQGLIATITFYMLSYTRNQQSNIFQIILGY